MPRSKTVLLIRHCEAIHGQGREEHWENRPYIGRTDPGLVPAGLAEAQRLAERLSALLRNRGEHMAVVALSSPARRALETARLATAGLTAPGGAGLSIESDPDLREIDFGRWEGLCFPEIAARDPALVAEWARGGMDFCFPEGESLRSFRERVARIGNRIRRCSARIVVVFTHGGVIRFLLCDFLGLPPSSHGQFQVETGSITGLHCRSDGTMTEMDEIGSERNIVVEAIR